MKLFTLRRRSRSKTSTDPSTFQWYFRTLTRLLMAVLLCAPVSCGGGGQKRLPPGAVSSVNAGPDQTVVASTTVHLVESGLDTGATNVTYRWEQTGGPPVVLRRPDQRMTSFVSPPVTQSAVLTFELWVTDDRGRSRSDIVEITVQPGSAPPIVSAGSDRNVQGGEWVSLKAIAQDSDGTIVSTAWQQVQGPAVVLEDVAPLTVRFQAPQAPRPEALVFQFDAADNAGATAMARVTIRVAATNFAPAIVRAALPPEVGGDRPVEVTFADPNGDSLEWRLAWSPDQGVTWNPASFRVDSLPPHAAGELSLRWNSVADLGFRQPRPVQLTITATDPGGAASTATLAVPAFDNRRAALFQVGTYAVYYGAVNSAVVAQLQQFDLVVLHPAPRVDGEALTRPVVAAVQQGRDPLDPADDVMVMCYLAVGEDLRSAALTDAQLRADPRFAGNGSGPRVDPRGTQAYRSRLPLASIDPAGVPSPGGTGWASWLLDDNSYAVGRADGFPDRNPQFGGTYVNMGDPAWFDVVDAMSSTQGDVPGLREILTTNYGRGLGCDGVFLDAIDVTAPNSFGSTQFEWTAPGVKSFVDRLRQRYPSTLVMLNRGIYFFHPTFAHYAFSPRDGIDALLFESYRLDASAQAFFNPIFFCDNKRNYMPKIMAEASLNRGFRVFSLGYAEGPADPVSGATLRDTLQGRSQYGLDTLLVDIDEAEQIAGFRHYLTNGALDLLNNFVSSRAARRSSAPRWSNTANNKSCADDPDPTLLPAPRVGIQRVVPVSGGMQIFWDVALAGEGVNYVLYYQTTPFDFTTLDPLHGASAVRLNPSLLPTYADPDSTTPSIFSSTVTGLNPGQTYFFLLRARENSDGFPEEINRVVMAAKPLP